MHHYIVLEVSTAAMLLEVACLRAQLLQHQVHCILDVGISITCYVSFRQATDSLQTPRHVLW